MAIALVATTGIAGNGAVTSITTGSADTSTTPATLLVMFIVSEQTPTPSDNQSNTWTSVGTSYSNFGKTIYCYYALAGSKISTTHTFTVTSASGKISCTVLAFTNTASASPLDANGPQGAADAFGTTIQAAGSFTPASANDVVCSAVYHDTNNTVTLDDGTFTYASAGFGNPGDGLSMRAAYVVQTTATAVNPTWTLGSTTYKGIYNVAFKEGTPPPTPSYEFAPGEAHRPYPFKPCGDAFRPAKYKDWR
jgi:hypothetical protein